jgi:N-acetylglucosamine malate deacetylase 1
MKKIVVISAHPDDEILGAGGTLLKHKKEGDIILWIIVTNMNESDGFSKERILSRNDEIQKVSKEMKFDQVVQLNYPTCSLSGSSLKSLVSDISINFNKFEPQVIYCPNRSDAHSDHRIIFDAVISCTKSFRYPFIEKVLMYECISETEFAPALIEKVFLPNYFVNISNYLRKKLKVMSIYSSEIGEHPFPRSLKNIEALSIFRGASSGFQNAEAFQLIFQKIN